MIRIMSCNVRYYGAKDGENNWEYRRDLFMEIVRSRSPDVICTQELAHEQCQDLCLAFLEFGWSGMCDEPAGRRPVNAIFYRHDAFDVVSAGGYWLSETPHVAGSSSWDSACVRLANWVRLIETASRRELRVVNTHLDHVSQPARENQARLICEDSRAYPDDYPQLLTGDMNCDTTNPAIEAFRRCGWRDTYGAVHGIEDPGHTFHGFQGPAFQSRVNKMDWVFARGELEVVSAEVIRDSHEGRFPSDHYFVLAKVEL